MKSTGRCSIITSTETLAGSFNVILLTSGALCIKSGIAFLHWTFRVTGVSNLSLGPDELHIVHLGVSQYAQGSVLWVLAYEVMEGSPEDNVAHIWELVARRYSVHSPDSQYTNITLRTFCDPDKADEFPRLRGRAAEAKDLLPAVVEIWHALGRSHAQYELIGTMLGALENVQNVLRTYADETFIPIPDVKDLQRHLDTFLMDYQRLAFFAETAGQCLWNNPSKFHWAWLWASERST